MPPPAATGPPAIVVVRVVFELRVRREGELLKSLQRVSKRKGFCQAFPSILLSMFFLPLFLGTISGQSRRGSTEKED